MYKILIYLTSLRPSQMKAKGVAAGKEVIGDNTLGGSRLGCPGAAKVRDDVHKSGIRRIRRDNSAQQDKVLYPLKAYS